MYPLQSQTQRENDVDNSIKQELNRIPQENIMQCMIFYILLILIDTSLFIKETGLYLFIIPKIIVSLILFIITKAYAKQINYFYLNILLFIAKGLSILFIYLFGQDYILIIAYVIQENNVNFEPFENFIQRILVKMICFSILIYQFDITNTFIMTSILLWELFKYPLLIQSQKVKKIDYQVSSPVNKQHQETITFCLKESPWVGRIKNLPFCYFLISKTDRQIRYKNQTVCDLFSLENFNEEELNDFILRKINFQIISENSQKNEIPTKLKQTFYDKKGVVNLSSTYKGQTQEDINLDNMTLEQILELYFDISKFENYQQLSSSLQIICQYKLNENKFLILLGYLSLKQTEDEIIFALIDVTKYNQYQEEKIKDSFKTSLVQSFSHELRTPLNSSLNFLQCCENDKSLCDDIKRNFISPAINALRLQAYLINDIIDFSSIQANNLKLNLDNFTIERVINEVNNLFKSVLELKNLVLYIDLTKNTVVNIRTDFQRLIQIIANILQNSIKFTNQGIILLKISSPNQNKLKISIKDQGFGIENQKLQQIQNQINEIDEQQNFSQQQDWNGFGLLISQLLIIKLKPISSKSLCIKSGGNLKGTKVTFYIENTIPFYKSSSINLKDPPTKMMSRLKSSLQSSNFHFSLNGTFIVISDLHISSKQLQSSYLKLTLPFSGIQNTTIKSKKSEDNISRDSLINQDYQSQIGDIHIFQPFLFTEIRSQNNCFYTQPQTNNLKNRTKILNYQQIRLQDEQESENQLKRCFENMKCKCKKILSVDDEIFNQKSIQFLLKQQGFDVVLAFNGEEAVQFILETVKCSLNCSLFLLVLMDYQMPIMNGLQATIKLKQMMNQQQIPNINIVGLTAFNSKNDIEKCLNSGMTKVLNKPLRIAELIEIIKII